VSFYVVDAVLKWDRYKNPTKAVLLALCSCINEERYQASGDTEVWPGTKRLMLLTGCSRDTIRRCIERLEQDGVITILSEGAGTETTHYIIHIAHIPQSCFIRSYMERTHSERPHEGDLRTTSIPHTGDLQGTYDPHTQDNYNGLNGSSPKFPEINLGESRLIKGNGGGSGEPTPVVAESTHVPAESYHRGGGERPGVVAESYPNKELNNEFNMERKRQLKQVNSPSARDSSSAFSDNPPEVELTPAEEELRDEMYEFARSHDFWKKFTRPPLSRFIKGCVESETFQKQFLKFKKARKKASSKVPSAPLFDTSDMDL
jgi:hypothetical protein